MNYKSLLDKVDLAILQNLLRELGRFGNVLPVVEVILDEAAESELIGLGDLVRNVIAREIVLNVLKIEVIKLLSNLAYWLSRFAIEVYFFHLFNEIIETLRVLARLWRRVNGNLFWSHLYLIARLDERLIKLSLRWFTDRRLLVAFLADGRRWLSIGEMNSGE